MNYEIMDDTVEKLCQSLENHSEEWVLVGLTIYNKSNPKIHYWVDHFSITKIHNNSGIFKVFSHTQGQKIYNAYLKAKGTQATVQQQKVIDAFKPKEVQEVSKPLPVLPEPKKTSTFKFWPFNG